jgi:hypothetical protein
MPTANLLGIMNYDFRVPLVADNITPNFNAFALHGSHVAKFVFVSIEDHAGEWAGAIILAEIQEGISRPGGISSQDNSRNTPLLAYQRPGIAKIYTGRRVTHGRGN